IYPGAPSLGRDALLAQLHAPLDLTRSTAFWVAAGVADKELEPALISGLRDPLADVRMAAAWGLGNLRDPQAAAALSAALEDPNDEVGRFARQALDRVDARKKE
ncbi:MAG TPA: HEAT repeat domain-containing protein, partial [Candidatus Acidoferrales bacterium]|nr:HEAT repeat domain-containing protein [Candidatus Acidoferrales bacterium]